jgi:hypothetical protein
MFLRTFSIAFDLISMLGPQTSLRPDSSVVNALLRVHVNVHLYGDSPVIMIRTQAMTTRHISQWNFIVGLLVSCRELPILTVS